MTIPHEASTDSPTQPTAVILGAGVAGLTAAYHLLKNVDRMAIRPRVVLLESEDRPGGLAVSLSRDGVVTDLGPHRLHTELPEVKSLLAEVAQEHLIEVRRESHLYWRGQRLAYPIAPLELLRKIGPWEMAKLGAGAALARLSGGGRGADSFERVMTAQFGPGLWREMLGPYSTKVWKRSPAEIHGDVARVRVSAGGLGSLVKRLVTFGREKAGSETALKSFRYPKGGLQTLVDILVERVTSLGGEIHTGAPVRTLETAPNASGGLRVQRIVAGSGTREIVIENPALVVSTLPLSGLATALGPAAPSGADALEYLSILLVVLIVERDRISRDNWLYFFDDNFVINRAYEAKNFDPSMAPPGRTVLCCEVTCRHGDTLWSGDRDALRQRVAREVASTGLFAYEEVSGGYVHPVRWAYPLYSLDYRERLRGIFGELARIENLISCGRQGLFNHNNTDHSMSMGMAAAEAWLADPQCPAPHWFEGVLERFGHFRIVD